MPIEPIQSKKVYLVGDRQFDDYQSARRYAADNRISRDRANLIKFFKENCHEALCLHDPESVLADLLLAAYEIKLKKRND
jgi:hypothetical protein